MLVVVLEQGDALAVTELAVDQARLAEAGPRAADVEEVLGRDAHQRRPGRTHRQIVGVLHAEGDLAGDILLGVLWANRRNEPFQRRDVARRGGTGDAVVEHHEIGGQGAAAGVAGTAELGCVDLGAACEIIEAADAVPDAIAGTALTDEQGADADLSMLAGAALDGGLELVDEELPAFALADRVVAQGRHAVLRQRDAHALIRLGRLAVVAVAARQEHARERALAVGQVQVRGDVMVRPAFVDDFLDAEAGTLEHADDPGVERRLLREGADRLQEFGAELILPLLDLRRRLQGGDQLLGVESRQPLENPGFLAFPQDARLRTWPVDIAKEGPFLPNVGANRHYRKGFPHEAVYPGGHAAGNPGSVRCA